MARSSLEIYLPALLFSNRTALHGLEVCKSAKARRKHKGVLSCIMQKLHACAHSPFSNHLSHGRIASIVDSTLSTSVIAADDNILQARCIRAFVAVQFVHESCAEACFADLDAIIMIRHWIERKAGTRKEILQIDDHAICKDWIERLKEMRKSLSRRLRKMLFAQKPQTMMQEKHKSQETMTMMMTMTMTMRRRAHKVNLKVKVEDWGEQEEEQGEA